MKMLTKELASTIPPLYTNENVTDPMVVAKYFTPWSNWTWYVTEGGARVGENENTVPLSEVANLDAADVLFFGYVEGLENELGYFSLNELKSVRGPIGLKIERDLYFTPAPLSTFKKERT